MQAGRSAGGSWSATNVEHRDDEGHRNARRSGAAEQPGQARSAARTAAVRGASARDRRSGDAGFRWRGVRQSQPGRPVARLRGRAWNSGRHRQGGSRCAGGIPGLARSSCRAPSRSAARHRGRDRATRRGHRRPRELGQRPADPLHVEGGAARRGEFPLLRGSSGVRPRRAGAPDGNAPQLHGPDADRTGRRDHALEHAVHAVDLEDRPGARRGMHRRAQAGGVEPGDRAAARRDCARGRAAAGCAERRSRAGRGGGSRAHRACGDPRHCVRGRVGHRFGDHAAGLGDPEAAALRARRQEPGDRVRRRGS